MERTGFYKISLKGFCESDLPDFEEPLHVEGMEPEWKNFNQDFYKKNDLIHYYDEKKLVGKQVIGVCNFPTKNIAGVVSEFLVLGAIEKDGKVVLLHPSQKVENGLEIA